MNLPAVVGLVIEPVRQRRRQCLLEFLRRGDAAVFDGAFDAPVVQPFHEAHDPPVLGLARGAQFAEGLEQDRVQPVRCVALAGKALHPDPVGDDEVVQRPVQRSEEGAARAAIGFVRQRPRRLVNPLIGPAIIGGEHLEMRFHRAIRSLPLVFEPAASRARQGQSVDARHK